MSNSAAIIYILLAVAIGYAFILPGYNDVLSLMDEKQGYQETLATVATIEAKKNSIMEKYNAIPESEKESIAIIVPDSPYFVKLVSQVDSVASKYGIAVDNIISREENPPSGGSIDTALPKSKYESWIIGFSFVSTYDNFRKFMDELERSLRVLDVKTVRINSQDESVYQFSVEFNAYWLK